MSEKCGNCGKAVYAAEQVRALGKSWHKSCIRCSTCSKVVTNGNWSDTGGKIYCNKCYENQFVDEETKQQVADLENGYAKKLHGGAKALPGFATSGTPPPFASKPRQAPPAATQSDAPPPPMRVMPSALLSGIVSSGGAVPKKGKAPTPAARPTPQRAPPPRGNRY